MKDRYWYYLLLIFGAVLIVLTFMHPGAITRLGGGAAAGALIGGTGIALIILLDKVR